MFVGRKQNKKKNRQAILIIIKQGDTSRYNMHTVFRCNKNVYRWISIKILQSKFECYVFMRVFQLTLVDGAVYSKIPSFEGFLSVPAGESLVEFYKQDCFNKKRGEYVPISYSNHGKKTLNVHTYDFKEKGEQKQKTTDNHLICMSIISGCIISREIMGKFRIFSLCTL